MEDEMQKWEYLDVQKLYDEQVVIFVSDDRAEALVEYLQGTLPRAKVWLDQKDKNWNYRPKPIKIKDSNGMEVVDALGEAGWEAVTPIFFKRPKP